MLFQPFKKATRPETPGYLNAEIQRADFENRAKQQKTALQQQNVTGAASIYSEAMAPDGIFGTQKAAPIVDANPIGLEPIANAVTPEATALQGYQASVAPEFAGAGAEAAAVVPEAVSAAELGAGIEGASALGAAEAAAATAEVTAGLTAAETATATAAAAELAAGNAAAATAAAGSSAALAAIPVAGWIALAGMAVAAASG